MLDFGFVEMLTIGAVALVVVGPDKLPAAARAAGRYIGRAQSYIHDIKAEMHRSAELHDLQKMKEELESSARELEQSARVLEQKVGQGVAALEEDMYAEEPDAADDDPLYGGWLSDDGRSVADDTRHGESATSAATAATVTPAAPSVSSAVSVPVYVPPRRNWRSRRGAMPVWYRRRHGVRGHVQSAAARTAQQHFRHYH